MGTRFDPSRRQHSVWTAEGVDDGKYSHAIPVTPEYYTDTDFNGLFYQERRDECDRLMGDPTQPINYHHDPSTEIPGGITEDLDPTYHYFVTKEPITWNDLPTRDSDNGSLELIDTFKFSFVNPEFPNIPPEYLPPDYVPGGNNETDAYRYKADFNWDNHSRNIGLRYLLDIEQFANNQIADGRQAFYSAENIIHMTALKDLDTSNLTSMFRMFAGCRLLNEPLDHFDTSNVTSMKDMFGSNFQFNQPLTNFDTSKVTDMAEMFLGAVNFNKPLDHFNTSLVTVMDSMFEAAIQFDQDISNWCVQLIPSKPNNFDESSLISQTPSKQPNWGAPC